MSDKELLALIRKDEKAFRELYARYWSKLYLYAFNVLKDQKVCEDILQDIFTDLWQQVDKKEIDHPSAYLYQATRYKIFNALRNGKTRQSHLERFSRLRSQTVQTDPLEVHELENTIRLLINKLPDRCRQIFVLSRYEYLSNQEIAQQLGISLQTVKNQISKALAYLREHLETEMTTLLFIFIMNG